MFPIWGLFTFLFVQQILKSTLAAQHEQLQAINEILAKRLNERPKSGEEFPSQPLVLNVGRQIETINAYDISHITVEEHYCSVFVLENEALRRIEVKLALKEALAQLPEDYFLQIHRSHLVNLAYVRSIRTSGRSCELLMENSDSVLPVSRHRLSEVLPRLKKSQK
jgi:DNA-binding LytR/AlgR family response regulator